MKVHSDSVFWTDQFIHDFKQYMKRNTTSHADTARMCELQPNTLWRILNNTSGVTLITAARMALYADLSLDKYVKSFADQEAYRCRNMTKMRGDKTGQVMDWTPNGAMA